MVLLLKRAKRDLRGQKPEEIYVIEEKGTREMRPVVFEEKMYESRPLGERKVVIEDRRPMDQRAI
jgi:hypothetical protein